MGVNHGYVLRTRTHGGTHLYSYLILTGLSPDVDIETDFVELVHSWEFESVKVLVV